MSELSEGKMEGGEREGEVNRQDGGMIVEREQ